jgi:predicted nucleic acid-binding Zn finger protein
MSINELDGHESIDPRTERALTEYMSVLPEGGDVYTVVGQNGGTYIVDRRAGRCTCPDYKHNLPTDDGRERCKHAARVAYATRERSVPAWIDTDAVDEQLGEHVNAGPQVVATDGGQVVEPAGKRVRVPVDGGVLVYERREVGKELVGFESVDDWDGVAGALRARGLGVGAIHHLPELDGEP